MRFGHSENPSKFWTPSCKNREGAYLLQKIDKQWPTPPTNELPLNAGYPERLHLVPSMRVIATATLPSQQDKTPNTYIRQLKKTHR
ncbi:MAG: hypothetical protein ACR2OA_05110 [Rubripirellula sp.]